jgi:Adenylate and Guanylate cyclase catalytic domain
MSFPNTEFMNVSSAQATLNSRKVTVTEAYLIASPDDLDLIVNNEETASIYAGFLPEGEEPMEPVSDIFYPILENAHKQIQITDSGDDHSDKEEHKVVAILSLSVYWRDTIRDILPEGSNGILLVFENPCNPTFTYQIRGPDVVFLGVGDFHDPKYSDMMVRSLMTELGQFSIQDSFYSGLPIDEDFCPFTISVYPSEEAEAAHTTATPWIFALVAVMVFVLTAATFVLYDFWVERRQRVVMKTAVTTTALVASLFPEVVRERIMPSGNENLPEETIPQNRLESFLNDGNKNDDVFDPQNVGASSATNLGKKPIADLFPDTSVFFADIVGFTAWSSVREPAHVFSLLEAIYATFDQVARRRGVFKVETIGDSYVAVCGLPEPKDNHASIVARFAFECMEKMGETTKELELSLGPGTGDLCLRVGLHSGPTIAGVLRGEKARFQLFGDTVRITFMPVERDREWLCPEHFLLKPST